MTKGEDDALTSYMKRRVGSNETPRRIFICRGGAATARVRTERRGRVNITEGPSTGGRFFVLRTLPDICGHFV